jgi:predicted Zn-dependent peptidase
VWRAPLPVEKLLPSGTRVLVLPSHELPLVRVDLVVRAGAELDPPSQPGLAAAGEQLGIDLDWRIDRDAAYLSFSVTSARLPEALALAADMAARPRFAAAEWARARGQRVAELVHLADEPGYIVRRAFERTLFGAHPYGSPAQGTPASVGAIQLADVKAFYAKSYGPRTTSVVLAGDVSPEAASQLVARALDGWKGTAAPAPSLPAPVIDKSAMMRFVLVDRPGAPQSVLRLGQLGPSRATPEYAPRELLRMTLGGSFTSRLVQNLREKHGYTYGVRASDELHRAGGSFTIETRLRSDATAAALDEIVKELKAVCEPLPRVELDKARALITSDLVSTYASSAQAAGQIVDLVAHDLPLDTWTRLGDALAGLDPAQVAKVAQHAVAPGGMTFVIVGDRKAIEPSLRKLPFVQRLEIRDGEGKLLPSN